MIVLAATDETSHPLNTYVTVGAVEQNYPSRDMDGMSQL